MSATETRERGAAGRVDFGRRTLVWSGPSGGVRVDLRTVIVCTALGVATAAIGLLALGSGDFTLSPTEVVGAIFGSDGGFAHTVVVDWRMPRVVAAIVFGAGLGVSGAIFQSLTRNPLASPDIIGFSNGSYTGALIVMLAFGGSFYQVAAGALAGGIATAAIVYLLAFKRGMQGFRLIVVGIAVSAMLMSLNTYLLLTAQLELALTAAVWGAGSLNLITWPQAALAGSGVVVLLFMLIGLARPLKQLELGDDTARALGLRTEPARLGLVVIGVALTAVITAAAGPIAFVALAAPQVGRRLVRTPGISLAAAAGTGALLLCAADYVAQHVVPTPLPVGVVTVVLGGGYLVWLLIREARRQL